MLDPVTGSIISTAVGGLADILGGGSSDPPGANRAAKEARVREAKWLYETYGKDSLEYRDWIKRNQGLHGEINRGKWKYIWDRRTPGPGTVAPRPTRAGDLPLRPTRDAVVPAIGGPLRKVGGTVLRAVPGASWGLFAASFVPPSWVVQGKESLGRYGAVMARGQARGAGPPPGGIARPAPRPPPSVPGRRVPLPHPAPAGPYRAPPVVRPEIQPVTVTARRYSRPTGAVTVTAPRTLKWWEKAIGALAKVPIPTLVQLLTKPRSTTPRTTVTVGPFVNPPAREEPIPTPTPLTPVETAGADCACPKKPRRPRKPRSECRTGRFIERLSGIQKYDTRKTKCLPSRKKRQSASAR